MDFNNYNGDILLLSIFYILGIHVQVIVDYLIKKIKL